MVGEELEEKSRLITHILEQLFDLVDSVAGGRPGLPYQIGFKSHRGWGVESAWEREQLLRSSGGGCAQENGWGMAVYNPFIIHTMLLYAKNDK